MNEVLHTLQELWMYDIEVFSKPWLYWWLLIPAFGYLMFFFLKWSVLTAPLWLPLVIALKAYAEARASSRKGAEASAILELITQLEDLDPSTFISVRSVELELRKALRKLGGTSK